MLHNCVVYLPDQVLPLHSICVTEHGKGNVVTELISQQRRDLNE